MFLPPPFSFFENGGIEGRLIFSIVLTVISLEQMGTEACPGDPFSGIIP